MHELSIAYGIVSAVSEALQHHAGAKVRSVRLRLGVLGGVVDQSLRFCWDVATAETPIAGATLDIVVVPAAIYCPACHEIIDLPDVRSFRCPRCQTPSADLRRGRELEIESLEVEETC